MTTYDLLPRDRESEEEYLQRLLSREKRSRENGYTPLSELLKEKRVETLFGFSPRLAPTFFSKGKLSRWIGGLTWILEDGTPVVELQDAFQKKKSFFGYSLEEIGAHEAVHVFRADFEGNRFEEIFAYQTSHSPLRRFLGPLFRSTWEPWIFMVTLIPPWFSLYGYFAPLLFLMFQLGRLLIDRYRLKKAEKSVHSLFPRMKSALPILVRMSEKEILFFSKASFEEIKEYSNGESLRWRQIKEISICGL